MSPELRPPLVAIPSVRDTAHAFTASGFSRKRWYDRTDWSNLFPYGSVPSAEAYLLPSHCNTDTKVVQCSGTPSLAGLHHIQGMTPWRWATTQPLSSFPHAGMVASSCETKWERSSPVPGQTTCRDPRSCLLYAGCIRNNVSTSWQTSRPHTMPCWPRCISHFHLCGFTALMQVSLRQQRNQVWLVNPCMAQSCQTFVPGLPTPTGATS
jgi:hypothetical protein